MIDGGPATWENFPSFLVALVKPHYMTFALGSKRKKGGVPHRSSVLAVPFEQPSQ